MSIWMANDMNKGINWHNLGQQLTEIASAFEVTYAPVMNDQQRQMYQVYRELKLKTLNLDNSQSDSVQGSLCLATFGSQSIGFCEGFPRSISFHPGLTIFSVL